MQNLQELESLQAISRPMPKHPCRDEHRVESPKLAVENMLRKVAKPAIDNLRDALNQAIATAEREKLELIRAKDFQSEQRDEVVKAQVEEKKAWMAEKAGLEAEILSGRTNHAQTFASAERERSNLTRMSNLNSKTK